MFLIPQPDSPWHDFLLVRLSPQSFGFFSLEGHNVLPQESLTQNLKGVCFVWQFERYVNAKVKGGPPVRKHSLFLGNAERSPGLWFFPPAFPLGIVHGCLSSRGLPKGAFCFSLTFFPWETVSFSFCLCGGISLPSYQRGVRPMCSGKSARSCSYLLFPFQHKWRECFSLKSPFQHFLWGGKKDIVLRHMKIMKTPQICSIFWSAKPPNPRLTEAIWRQVSSICFLGEKFSVYSMASDTPRIVGYVNPLPRQCKFLWHCMWLSG